MKSDKFATFKRRALHVALASAVVLGGTGHVINAYAATASGTANATVVAPIAIAATAALNFGSFSTSAVDQTVTIAPNGTRTNNGTLLVNSVNTPTAASFDVTGSGTLTYAITLPSTVQIQTLDGTPAAETMQVGTFTSNPSGTGVLTAGAQTLTVGATVTTVASQVAGVYTGSFNVTVQYN